MEKQDILLKTRDGLFSYRVAGVLIQDGKVLLHHEVNDPAYAFPGGHVNFGEVSQDALVREFKEETAADIRPERLLWLGENFYPWGENDCHQICLYYLVSLCNGAQIPLDGSFMGVDVLGETHIDLEYCWIPLADLGNYTVYPLHAHEKLRHLSDHTETFVYRECVSR